MTVYLGEKEVGVCVKNTNIQPSKSVTITSNTTTTVTPDSGYAGVSSVSVTTDIPQSDYIRPSDWLEIPTMDGTNDEVYIINGVGNKCLNKIYIQLSGTGTIDWGDGSEATTFTNASSTTYSHEYNYDSLPSSSWTEHNKTRQALIHISGNRGAITKFNTGGITYQYTNADGITNNYSANCSTDIYQISANVNSANVKTSANSKSMPVKMEIFDWKGNITNYDISYMFNGCASLQSIPQLNFTNSNIISGQACFQNCRKLKKIPNFNGSNIKDYSLFFSGCLSLVDIPNLNLSNATRTDSMFKSCYIIESITNLNTKSSTNMESMFEGCTGLKIIKGLVTNKATQIGSIFKSCYSLQNVEELDCSSVSANISDIFTSCSSLKNPKMYNFNPGASVALTLTISSLSFITKQELVDFFNSLAVNSSSYGRTISLGNVIQGYLTGCYVKDSGEYYKTKIPTADTSIQSGKTYYTYNMNTDTYTQVTPDFSTNTVYYEEVTATWNKYVICESTDTGAMLALDYARNIKGYTIT